jgi:hypothetical protein
MIMAGLLGARYIATPNTTNFTKPGEEKDGFFHCYTFARENKQNLNKRWNKTDLNKAVILHDGRSYERRAGVHGQARRAGGTVGAYETREYWRNGLYGGYVLGVVANDLQVLQIAAIVRQNVK